MFLPHGCLSTSTQSAVGSLLPLQCTGQRGWVTAAAVAAGIERIVVPELVSGRCAA